VQRLQPSSPAARRGNLRARPLPAGAIAGAIVAALILAAGLLGAATQARPYAATAALIVEPRAGSGGADALASLYDTLSRGQVPATYAEILRGREMERAAERTAGVAAADQGRVTVATTVVADTAILDVTATAARRSVAVGVANALAQQAIRRIDAMGTPYGVRLVSPADGTAVRTGVGAGVLTMLTVLVALLAGVLVQQGWAGLRRGVRWDRELAQEWPASVPDSTVAR